MLITSRYHLIITPARHSVAINLPESHVDCIMKALAHIMQRGAVELLITAILVQSFSSVGGGRGAARPRSEDVVADHRSVFGGAVREVRRVCSVPGRRNTHRACGRLTVNVGGRLQKVFH